MLITDCSSDSISQQVTLHTENIFPYVHEHVHGSTIVELPNRDLLVAWFQGSGERWADDVKIMGARKKKGSDVWSEPFLMADVKKFPDINPVLFLDGKERLWLMWYTVIANQWSTSLINYRISENYQDMAGAPEWDWQENLLVKPGDITERGIQPEDKFVESVKRQVAEYGTYLRNTAGDDAYKNWLERSAKILEGAAGLNMVKPGIIFHEDGSMEQTELGYPYFRRMGWQTRSKPVITPSGRIIVPLYSDGFSFSLMALTDDSGKNWHFSEPLVGAGSIQPAIAISNTGNLTAYMRNNGPPPKRLYVSHSIDDGKTWSNVELSKIPNPGAGSDIVNLSDGSWLLVNNDAEQGRHSLAVYLSEDDGYSWPWEKRIFFDEQNEKIGAYPAIIQGKNGEIHVTYSYFLPYDENGLRKKSIRHAVFPVSWIKSD